MLFLSNPPASSERPARMLDDLAKLNQLKLERDRRPRDRHAHRPVRDGLPHADERAGADRPVEGTETRLRAVRPRRAASRAPSRRNCLLARRLAERGVRFIQLFHRGWDQHVNLPKQICRAVPRHRSGASAALITDLKQRGLLDDTLVVWGGEFGRTVYCQGKLTADNYGRDHHPRCFTDLDGRRRHQAGHRPTARPTTSATTSSKDPVHVHDLNATILHCLGIDHTKLTFKFQGRDFRLTDVFGNVVTETLA